MGFRDLCMATVLVVLACLVYAYIHSEFYLDRMTARGAQVYVNLDWEPSTLELESPVFADRDLKLVRTIPTLRKLSLAGSAITDQGLKHLQGTQLAALDLSHTLITNDGLATLTTLEALEQLQLNSTPITQQGLLALQRLPKLKTLSLDGCHQLAFEDLLLLAKLPELRQISLRGVPIQYDQLIYLTNLMIGVEIHADADLVLGLVPEDPWEADWQSFPDQIALKASSLQRDLTELPLVMKTDLLQRVQEKQLITRLEFSAETPLAAEAISELANFPKLRSLHVSGEIDDEFLAELTRFQQLDMLGIESAIPVTQPEAGVAAERSVSRTGICALCRMPNLRGLAIGFPVESQAVLTELVQMQQLEALDLSGLVLSGEDLGFLFVMNNLKYLRLNGFKLSNPDLHRLEQHPTLVYLMIEGSKLEQRQQVEITRRFETRLANWVEAAVPSEFPAVEPLAFEIERLFGNGAESVNSNAASRERISFRSR